MDLWLHLNALKDTVTRSRQLTGFGKVERFVLSIICQANKSEAKTSTVYYGVGTE